MPPLRRLFAVGLWLAVTASATAIVWAGTSTVAANLTDRPAPVVPHRDVVLALESGTSEPAETTPGITTPNANGAASTGPSDDSGSASSAPQGPESAPSGAEAPEADVSAPVPPPPPPPVDPGTPPTTQPPLGPTASYSTTGGVVTVTCESYFFIRLVSATPSNGYAANVVSGGPYYVEVHFVRAGQDAPIWAFCLGAPVRAYGGSPGPWQMSGFGTGG